MKRCPKHEPVPRGGVLDRLGGAVKCANCGRYGSWSNGQRKYGRPRKVKWYSPLYSEMLEKRDATNGADSGQTNA